LAEPFRRNIRVVLVRPRRGGNVGSTARVMKNMGLDDLVLVAPRARIGATAARMAAHADDVLRRRRSVPDLATALSDVTLAVATVGRDVHPDGEPPRSIASEIVAEARRGRVALVFGPEDHGLATRDLDQCQRRLRIPSSPAYASLNLAQAVAICAYEIRLAAAADTTSRRARKPLALRAARREAELGPASGAEREALFSHLESALLEVGFLSQQNPAHAMRDVRSLFARSGLSRRDVKIWRGIARQILWAARRARR
jgi:TrmH family RNA methyltransferase